ncbi:MAG: hypothetical protein R2827_09870 [Bdellovibrionales bacterium]
MAEVEVIKRNVETEAIRRELGLSRRKISQLLMVDPSAWTRWSRDDNAPPHIYRSLQWYLSLIDKHPEWHPQNSFNRILNPQIPKEESTTDKDLIKLTRKLQYLEQQISIMTSKKQKSQIPKTAIKWTLLAIIATAGGYLLSSLFLG